MFILDVNEIKDSLDKDLVYLIDGKRVNGTHKGVAYLNELLESETTGEIVESSEKISVHGELNSIIMFPEINEYLLV